MANIIGTQTVNGIYILNTDTNPTLTGGVDAPIGSWGLAGDGSGFFYKFGASNTDWEQGASTSSIAGYNVLLVRKNPSVGQYATIEDAINAITAPSTNNRWLILVGVGQFIENTLSPPNYTSIIGASIQETQIFPATATQHIWELGEYNEISFMWLEGAGPGYSAIHVNDSGNYSQAHKVTFNDNDINILVESSTQDTFFYGEYLDFNGTYSYGLKVISTGGFKAFANVENYYNYPTGGTTIANYITGTNADVDLLAGGCLGINVGTAFYIQDGASLQLTSFNINNFDKAIHNGNVGAACNLLVSGVVAKDIATYDIQIEHLLTSGTVGGVFDDTKISLASSLVGLLVQDTNDGSLLITNKLNVLFSNGTITDVSSLIIEGATMGIERGGTLSDGGGFNVDVLAGNGYFELFPDVDIVKRLDWANTSIALSANVNVFIYFNNNGILVSNGAQPDTRYNILLGRVVTNGTGIEFIDATPLTAEHTSNLILNNLREAIGSIYASGSIVTENATPLNLDVTSGEYYFGENEFLPSGGTGITFTAIYGQGSGVITGQTAVNNTQYDNAGTLTALTAGYYAKGSLYLVGDGANEKYYFVFAQAEYSTLLAVQQADIPLPPNYFSGSVVLIAGIIIQEGNPNIVQIIDQRPIIGFRSFGVTASADHLSLLNLNGGVNGDGGHTNMFTVNGSKPMTGNINMATNNIINIGTANGVTIEAHASRHLPNGLDPLVTAAPTTNLSGSSTNSVGIQNSFSRSDHSHAITGAALTSVDDTNVTLTLGGTPATALLNSASLTLGWTGQLSIARGGTGASVANDALNNLLPSQALNVGKILQTDGTNTSWVTVTGALGFTPVNKAGDNGVGLITFLNNQGIDVDATGGTDVLNIGTSNADIINIGWSGAQVNILGTTFYENVTELQVKDKLFTVNKGGAAGSGASAGFEIEEGGVITGYFATSGTRDGWDFKAPAIASYATLSLANLTANSIFFLPDVANKTLATIDGGQTFTSATWNGGVIGIAYGGTNSSTALNNNRLMISSGGSIVEHSAQTVNQVAFYDANGLPTGSVNFTFIAASGLLAKGGSSAFGTINHVFKNATGVATADVAIYGTGALALGTIPAIGDKLAVNGKIRAFVSGTGAALQIDTGSITVNQTASPTAFVDIAPSTVDNTQLRLRVGVTPTLPNDGELWYDSSLKFYNGTSTVDLSGTVIATRGGTGQTVYAIGDLLYANTTTTLAKLADVATGNALISGGVGVAPSWGKIGLATHVSGTLPIANGGTGQITAILAFNALSPLTTKGDIVTHDGTNNIRKAIGSNTQVLISDSTQASGNRWGDIYSSIISPAAFAATQNDYNPAGLQDANVLRLTSTGAQSITGITAPSTNKTIIIFNIGAANITLTDASAGSVAANRFQMNGNTILNPNEGIELWYDITTARWRAIGRAI